MGLKNTYSHLIDNKKRSKSQFLKEEDNNKDKNKHKRVIMLEWREREREIYLPPSCLMEINTKSDNVKG